VVTLYHPSRQVPDAPPPRIARLLLNVDTTVMPFVQTGNLVQVAAAFLNRRPNDLAKMDGREKVALDRFLLGCKVLVKQNSADNVSDLSLFFLGGCSYVLTRSLQPHMRYKIKALSNESAANKKFQTDEGKTVSVAQYFRGKYNVHIQHANLPCVQVTKRAFYPMASIH
jgi:eukaryotic translation initiation factor 2C